MNIGYQGIAGAYSEIAGLQFFDGLTCTLVGCAQFEDIFRGVQNGSFEYGILPIENSLAGSVHKNIDLLNAYELKIVGEVYLHVEHNLLGISGTSLKRITEVYSHWQALAQCEDTLHTLLPSAHVSEYYDTASAAAHIAQLNDPTKAAIASSLAAEKYSLAVLRQNIEDNANNYTRFIIIHRGYENLKEKEGGTYKTSITFSGKSIPGFLYHILKSFAQRNINLTKIESRPVPERTWGYFFYIDFEGKYNDSACADALQEIQESVPDLKILGSYPRGIYNDKSN